MASQAKNRVLITGAEGYLGSVIAPFLMKHGHEVIGLDTGFFRDSLLYELSPYGVIKKDARDFSEKDLKGIDVVVHLAGISNDPFGNLTPEKIYDPTRVYAREIAALCKKNGVRFIFASSCSIYGKAEGAVLDENSIPNPQTDYSKNKLQVEEDLAELSDKSFSPIALRFATAFGSSPRMRFDIVVNMLSGMAFSEGKIVLNSDGEAWRPNVHVEDIARAVEAAVRSSWSGGELLVLNVGRDDNNMKIIDIAKVVAEECGAPISFLSSDKNSVAAELVKSKMVAAGGADTRNYRVSFAKITKQFPDFVCKYSILDGVREMFSVFKKIKLSPEKFRDRRFYRLQRIEDLFTGGGIDSDLRWTRKGQL